MRTPQHISKDKVFCRGCEYLKYVGTGHNVWSDCDKFICKHPKNRAPKYDSWLKPHDGGKKEPKVINKKNNCGWYKRVKRSIR